MNITEYNQNNFDERKVINIYKKLEIDLSYSLDIRELGKEYQDLMMGVEFECYATTAYMNR